MIKKEKEKANQLNLIYMPSHPPLHWKTDKRQFLVKSQIKLESYTKS